MAIDSSDSHHCYEHDESGDGFWWSKHLEDYSHLHTGVGKCKDCNKPDVTIEFTGKLYGGALPPALCEDCKKRR